MVVGSCKKNKMIALLSCSKSKATEECLAYKMYQGTLFSKAYSYCLSKKYIIYILSAKYKLLNPMDIIKPYNLTLNNMRIKEKQKWSDEVIFQLKQKKIYNKEIIVFAGSNYYKLLNLPNAKYPIAKLSQGRQLQWFNNKLIKQKGFFL